MVLAVPASSFAEQLVVAIPDADYQDIDKVVKYISEMHIRSAPPSKPLGQPVIVQP